MKLLVNGCSFTGGNDVVHDEEGVLAPIPDYVWSNYTGVDTTNIAIAGNSNDKIIRTTLEHLKQKDDYDGVIVQWTALYRLERYIEQYDVWGNICNKINVLHKEETSPEQVQQLDINNMFGLHFDKMEEDHNERVNTLSKVLQTASEIYIWLNSDVDYKIKFMQDVLLMQYELEKMDMPYLFTSMSMANHVKYLTCQTDYEKILNESIDTNKWTKRPLTHMNNSNISSDGHPNSIGHKLIAGELMREFRRVNG